MSSDTDDGAYSIALILFFGGLVVFGWQAYEYLRYSVWPPLSIITVLEWMKLPWAFNPTDWVGVHNILSNIPLSIAMFASAWMVASSIS